MQLSLDGSTELEHLRRLAQVARQLLQAEATYVRTRDRHDLLVLRDTKYQVRRLLEQHARTWGSEIPMPTPPAPAAPRPTADELAGVVLERERLEGEIAQLRAQLAAAIARAEHAEAERDHLLGYGVRCNRCRVGGRCESADTCDCECHLLRCQARRGVRQCHFRENHAGEHASGTVRWEATGED